MTQVVHVNIRLASFLNFVLWFRRSFGNRSHTIATWCLSFVHYGYMEVYSKEIPNNGHCKQLQILMILGHKTNQEKVWQNNRTFFILS